MARDHRPEQRRQREWPVQKFIAYMQAKVLKGGMVSPVIQRTVGGGMPRTCVLGRNVWQPEIESEAICDAVLEIQNRTFRCRRIEWHPVAGGS
jgi:hypothetical protein